MLTGRDLGLLFARIRKSMRREFELRLEDHELTVPQVHVLGSLWEEDGKTISQLTNHVCSDGPTLTSLLDRMETKGLISRERDSTDRRMIRIYLQERGRGLEQEVIRVGDEVMALIRRGMTEDQLD
ncbi:MAG: MarR family transcriptional regulator, partial [Armatimonadota bacterium]|nr:MarR family transcriptional regulator [Armatimonadota bacterium]